MQKLAKSLKKLPSNTWRSFARYYKANLWHKILVFTVTILLLGLGFMYGVARWYIAQNNDKPVTLGVSFIPAYADSLGLDPKETMDALIEDLGVTHFRLVSYWNQLEPEQGKYDFSLLDWQFEKAEMAEAKVTLSVGLRQPRWPECHIPDWAEDKPVAEWQPHLESFMREVIKRYKDSPALESYQLENEYFLENFGHCKKFGFSRDRLIREAELIKEIDPWHPLIMSRSNNIAVTMPIGEPRPDAYGISIYKRVWDSTLTKRYLEYPFPAWYYAFEAGMHKILTGNETIIHELQAEAWPPEGKFITHINLAEQNKSFNAERFKHRLEFGRATGMREMYLWGAEYWYYRMVHEKDPSLWLVAKEAFSAEENR
jgi:beta-galactosidase GanA